jgi:transcriptional regulator with XRE-family HTH domain
MRSALADFLRTRRAQIRPEQVGLPAETGRKVPGLRREEVAHLADISPEYYLRLEQGRHRQPSPQVLSSLGRALLLDEDGVTYLHRLVRLDNGAPSSDFSDAQVAHSVQRTIDALPGAACVVLSSTGDVIRASDGLVSLIGDEFTRSGNLVLSVFSQSFRSRTSDWEHVAEAIVANLRFRADPADPHLREIVGLLSLRDPDFRRMWAQHRAGPWNCGSITFRATEGVAVGIAFQNFEIPGTPGWVLSVLRAEAQTRRAPAHVRSDHAPFEAASVR